MSNSERRYTIEFGIDMVPAMLHALSLAGCTAMMCGGPRVRREFNAQYAALARSVTDAATEPDTPHEKMRQGVPDEYAWWRVCQAARKCATLYFHHYDSTGSYWRSGHYNEGRVWPVIDAVAYDLGFSHRGDNEVWPHFEKALVLLAPITALRLPDVREACDPDNINANRRDSNDSE